MNAPDPAVAAMLAHPFGHALTAFIATPDQRRELESIDYNCTRLDVELELLARRMEQDNG